MSPIGRATIAAAERHEDHPEHIERRHEDGDDGEAKQHQVERVPRRLGRRERRQQDLAAEAAPREGDGVRADGGCREVLAAGAAEGGVLVAEVGNALWTRPAAVR